MKLSLLALLVALPAAAQPAKAPIPKARPSAADAAKGCDTLQSPQGNVQKNLGMRNDAYKKLCEGQGLQNELKKTTTNLKGCEEIGIKVDIFFPEILERSKKACYSLGIDAMKKNKVCKAYPEVQQNSKNAYDAGMATGQGSTQAGPYQLLSRMHNDLVAPYKGFAADMEDTSKTRKEYMPGLKEDPAAPDPVMADSIRKFKGQLKSLTSARRAQLSAYGADRTRVAAQQGDEGSIRVANQEQLGKMWTGIVKCEAAFKDGGDLDQFNKFYQSRMAAQLVRDQQEADTLKDKFNADAAEHEKYRKQADDTAKLFADQSSPNADVRNEANGGLVRPNTPMALKQSDPDKFEASSINNGTKIAQGAGSGGYTTQEAFDRIGTFKPEPVTQFRNGPDGQPVEYRIYTGTVRGGTETRQFWVPVKLVR